MVRNDYDNLTGSAATYFVDWTDLKKFVLLRDKYRCKDCGKQSIRGLKVHHNKPLLSGGSNNIDNLVTLCTVCHKKRHNGHL